MIDREGQYRGAKFYRCALQVNSHSYLEQFRGQKHMQNEDAYIQELVRKAKKLGVEVLGITNHNSVESVDRFQSFAKAENIAVFPGFELTSSEGVHVLCLYEPDTSLELLGRHLGAFGIKELKPNSDCSPRDFRSILKMVQEDQHGIVIAAHVTSKSNGLLKTLQGKARINAWKDQHLLAVQIPGDLASLPEELKDIFKNTNKDYRREPEAGESLAVAVINAKDLTTPEDLEDPSATCLIKMTRPSIDGLRQAFLDPDSRVRLNSEQAPPKHSELISLAWEGGFLNGNALYFSDNLNVLIGGRGAGKSTIIESLRAVLQSEPIGEEAKKQFASVVREVLKSGTKISLVVRSHHPKSQTFLIERTLPNPPIVKDEKGHVLSLKPSEILPGLEIYGQHEIGEISRDSASEKRIALLRRFLPIATDLNEQEIESLRRALEKNRTAILSWQKESKAIEDELSRLPGIEEQLKRFVSAGVEEKLKAQSFFIKEEKLWETIGERMESVDRSIEVLKESTQMDLTFLEDQRLEDLPSAQKLKEGRAILQKMTHQIQGLVGRIEDQISQSRLAIDIQKKSWTLDREGNRKEYEQTLRDLQQERIDGTEFLNLRKQIERLRPLKEKHSHINLHLEEERNRRKVLLSQWEEIQRKKFVSLDEAGKMVGRTLRNRLRVGVRFAANRTPLERFLKDRVGGRISEAIERLNVRPDLSIQVLTAAMREGKEALVREFGLSPGQAERFGNLPEGVILELEELVFPPEVDLEMNIATMGQSPDWKPVEDLSTGQKATAILMLLFLNSEAPLVIDQPEDDLDNRFITGNIVPELKKEKRKRQFVFATHNANIPVLGDAELIVGITPDGEAGAGQSRIEREHVGSVDSPSVRHIVEDILEGGKEAFERRRAKYGF